MFMCFDGCKAGTDQNFKSWRESFRVSFTALKFVCCKISKLSNDINCSFCNIAHRDEDLF